MTATIFKDFENMQEITEIYVVLSIDSQGKEGIYSVNFNNMNYPMVFGYKSILEIFLPFVKASFLNSGSSKELHLVKFNNKEIIEEIK